MENLSDCIGMRRAHGVDALPHSRDRMQILAFLECHYVQPVSKGLA